MKKLKLTLAMLSISSMGCAQLKLELGLTPSNRVIECEPVQLRVAWRNIGKENLRIGPEMNPISSGTVEILVNGVSRKQLRPDILPNYSLDAPIDLKPGESREGITGLMQIAEYPGSYKLRAVSDFSSRKVRPGFYSDRTESNEITLTILSPAGEEATLFEKARSRLAISEDKSLMHDANGKIMHGQVCAQLTDSGTPEARSLLDSNLGSLYTAYVILPSVPRLESDDPAAYVEMLHHHNLYDNSVPDSAQPTGWRDMRGKEYANWLNEWCERILKHHPDFPYARRLKLVVGYDSLLLGDNAKAVKYLSEVASSVDTPEGVWVARFLALKNSKPK